MTFCQSIPMILPNPWQVGQAPMGLLKEKRRGSGSEKSLPQRLQEKLRLKVDSFPVLNDDFNLLFPNWKAL